jgi:hypothetical protein
LEIWTSTLNTSFATGCFYPSLPIVNVNTVLPTPVQAEGINVTITLLNVLLLALYSPHQAQTLQTNSYGFFIPFTLYAGLSEGVTFIHDPDDALEMRPFLI